MRDTQMTQQLNATRPVTLKITESEVLEEAGVVKITEMDIHGAIKRLEECSRTHFEVGEIITVRMGENSLSGHPSGIGKITSIIQDTEGRMHLLVNIFWHGLMVVHPNQVYGWADDA